MKSTLLLLLPLVLGCPASTAPSAQAPAPSGDQGTFEHLDLDHRIEFMKTVVVPTMKPIFQNHDPKKFSSFGCPTCHGASATTGDYEMPNTELPKLDFADLSRFQPADLEWMQNEVKPAMAKLLKLPESTRTRKGFGCLVCHTKQ